MIFSTFLELGMWWFRNNPLHLRNLLQKKKPRKTSAKLSKDEVSHEMRSNRPSKHF